MVGIVIVTHGGLAEGLVDAARMIVGQVEGLAAVALNEGDPTDELKNRIEIALQSVDQGDGVLLMVDMLGATPFNVGAKIALTHPQADVVTGVNLPMLLETALQREAHAFEALVGIAKQAGADSVKVLSESLRSSGS